MEYNPIWNVDANVSHTETRDVNRDITRDQNISDNKKQSSTSKETPNLSDTRSVKGFNSTAWAEAEKNEKTGTDTITSSGNEDNTIKDNETVNEVQNDNNIYTERRTGNIGVTTTQKMILEERQIAEFSIINYITLSFKERFCLLVY